MANSEAQVENVNDELRGASGELYLASTCQRWSISIDLQRAPEADGATRRSRHHEIHPRRNAACTRTAARDS